MCPHGLFAQKRLIWPFIPNFITGISIAGILLTPTAGFPDITPAAKAGPVVTIEEPTKTASKASASNTSTAPKQPLLTRMQIAARVETYFNRKGHPFLVTVARCESRFRHFDRDGAVLLHHNSNGTYDIGVMQINSIWLTQAKKLGFDLMTLEDNLAFASWLYSDLQQRGVDPLGSAGWGSSGACWAPNPNKDAHGAQLASNQ